MINWCSSIQRDKVSSVQPLSLLFKFIPHNDFDSVLYFLKKYAQVQSTQRWVKMVGKCYKLLNPNSYFGKQTRCISVQQSPDQSATYNSMPLCPKEEGCQSAISLENDEFYMLWLNHILRMNPARTIPTLTISVFWLSPKFTQLCCLGIRVFSFHNTCLNLPVLWCSLRPIAAYRQCTQGRILLLISFLSCLTLP